MGIPIGRVFPSWGNLFSFFVRLSGRFPVVSGFVGERAVQDHRIFAGERHASFLLAEPFSQIHRANNRLSTHDLAFCSNYFWLTLVRLRRSSQHRCGSG